MTDKDFDKDFQENKSEPEASPEQENKKEAENITEAESENMTYIGELERLAAKTAEGISPRKLSYDYEEGAVKIKKHSLFWRQFLLLLAVFVILFFAAARLVFGKNWIANRFAGDEKIHFSIPIAELPQASGDVYTDAYGRYTAQGVAKAVGDSVVTVESYKKGQVFASVGQGSGVIMTSDGYIITNAHVIADATLGVKVVLANEDEYEAKIIGADSKTDLAVLKIAAEGLTPVQFGDSTKLELGEDVVAIGSPAGFQGSVTKGIVSGLQRMVRTETVNLKMDCIQIDAAINPGNSGGALFNMYGQLVGITSSKLSPSEFEGIGFAISMDAAKPVIESLIEYGYVASRPKLGITFYSISETTAKMYGTHAGLYIVSIDETCDIANTELLPDDIIFEMNGVLVTDIDEVYDAIDGLKPGDTVSAKVFRQSITGDGEEFEISFKLMEDTSSFVEQNESEAEE